MGAAVVSQARCADGVRLKGILELRKDRVKGGSVDAGEPEIFAHLPQESSGNTVVIDFSRPEAMPRLIAAMSGSGIRLVCGTTGLDRKERQLLKEYSQEIAVLYDENMSYGILALKKLLRTAAPLFRGYDVEIVETHHAGKRDRPSGTALALSEVISTERADGAGAPRIHSLRLGGVSGEHRVLFANQEEAITLSHRALSRDVFARGAIRAARFITEKTKGFYRMSDLLEGAS